MLAFDVTFFQDFFARLFGLVVAVFAFGFQLVSWLLPNWLVSLWQVDPWLVGEGRLISTDTGWSRLEQVGEGRRREQTAASALSARYFDLTPADQTRSKTFAGAFHSSV